MSVWTRYAAVLSEKADPYQFLVYVYGMTEEIARQKLHAEYSPRKYDLVRFSAAPNDPLSDPNAPKSYK